MVRLILHSVNFMSGIPQIVQDEKSATCFLLHSQKFIELVRAGALEEAVHYGRIELAKFFKLPGFDDLVRDCAALLAYEQPHQCSAGYLLEESQREIVADAVKWHDFVNRSEREGCTKLLEISS
ncbi:hypothetical protein OIU84_017343 [Salix udensis]|uniref:CTLH domain-containing protein n=1 Tax=Salix udensis TaxID=889485 RepID=A0AAD6L1U1_9ROSI|nr:hypothetical protein OIU84_017343 [Salix udensis]